MAIASAPATESIIDQVVLSAFKKAGLLPIEYEIGADSTWAAKSSHGRDILNRIIYSPEVNSSIDYFMDFDDVVLTANEQYYTMNSDVLNVIGDASYIPADNADTKDTDGETIVTQINVHRWNTLSSKNASGRPSLFYVKRTGKSIQVRLWPQPDEAGTIRFQVHTLAASSKVGSDDFDLRRYWENYLVHAVACELMVDSKMPVEDQTIVLAERNRLLVECKKAAEPNEPPVLILTHRTGWSNM
jgi:hypothetical protein